jgi:predicted O-methyltransferase YrrM
LRYAVLDLPQTSDTLIHYNEKRAAFFHHPVCAWLGIRPVLAQHTAAEHACIQRWAAGRASILEIGVAEGVSAWAIRESMASQGTLYLVDPYHLSRIRKLNFTKRAAHRAVGSCRRGSVVWIEKFSHDAAKDWTTPLDFLLIDGDHSDKAVEQDWNDWSPFVQPGGIVIFHDAVIFEGGWPSSDYGPVKFVNRLFRENRSPEWTIVEEIHSLLVVERHR